MNRQYQSLPPEHPRAVALETEYTLYGYTGTVDARVVDLAREQALEESYETEYCSGGHRLYGEYGEKIEVAGPESLTVKGLLASHYAGQNMAYAVARHIVGDGPGSLYKRTIDSVGNTAGEHENYHVVGNPDDEDAVTRIVREMVTHLATRQVITGPGMLRQRINGEIVYMLDQRHHALADNQAREYYAYTALEDGRKVFVLHRPDESFDNRGQSIRLQVASGSQNMFPWPIAARIMTTSAVLRLIEHRQYPSQLMLANPYGAVQQTGGVHGITMKHETLEGKHYTALEIQLMLAERVLDFGGKYDIPAGELAIARTWRTIADDFIAGDFDPWTGHVEWLAKQRYLDAHRSKSGHATYTFQEMEREIRWHEVSPKTPYGPIQKVGRLALLPAMEDISQATKRPLDATRAQIRSEIIRTSGKELVDMDWSSFRIQGDAAVELPDVYIASLGYPEK